MLGYARRCSCCYSQTPGSPYRKRHGNCDRNIRFAHSQHDHRVDGEFLRWSATSVYNSTLKAPECATVGTSCDSGPSLLLGRDHISGGEPNQPNTINNSCADGTTGTFHSDESNDRIVVTSSSGSLTHGSTATVSATVWAYAGFTSDALDLYYAANANSPSWTFIKTIVPTKAGAQTLSTTFTLPTGSLQAVRAQFRYLGSRSSCTTGPYNDHDDLIFAVQ